MSGALITPFCPFLSRLLYLETRNGWRWKARWRQIVAFEIPPPFRVELSVSAAHRSLRLATLSLMQSMTSLKSDSELPVDLPEQTPFNDEVIGVPTESSGSQEGSPNDPTNGLPLDMNLAINWQRGGLLGQGSFGTVHNPCRNHFGNNFALGVFGVEHGHG